MRNLLIRFVYWLLHGSANTLSAVLDWLDPLTDERCEQMRRESEGT